MLVSPKPSILLLWVLITSKKAYWISYRLETMTLVDFGPCTQSVLKCSSVQFASLSIIIFLLDKILNISKNILCEKNGFRSFRISEFEFYPCIIILFLI